MGKPARERTAFEIVAVYVDEELVHNLVWPEATQLWGDLEGAVRQGAIQSMDDNNTKSPSEMVMVNDNWSQGVVCDPISKFPQCRQINKSNLKKPSFSSQKSHRDWKKNLLF